MPERPLPLQKDRPRLQLLNRVPDSWRIEDNGDAGTGLSIRADRETLRPIAPSARKLAAIVLAATAGVLLVLKARWLWFTLPVPAIGCLFGVRILQQAVESESQKGDYLEWPGGDSPLRLPRLNLTLERRNLIRIDLVSGWWAQGPAKWDKPRQLESQRFQVQLVFDAGDGQQAALVTDSEQFGPSELASQTLAFKLGLPLHRVESDRPGRIGNHCKGGNSLQSAV